MNYTDWANQHPEAARALNAVQFAPVDKPNTALTEQAVQQECRFNGVSLGMWLMRNNSGAYNDKQPPSPGTRWGLGNDSKKINDVMKSSDLIGCTTVTITPSMVGRNVAVFTAIEVKDPDWVLRPGDKRAAAQAAFMNGVATRGGISGFVTNAEQLAIIKQEYLK